MATEHHGRIHLLLADVVLPEMSGPQALEQIRARHPNIKVLFMSGYTDEAMVHSRNAGGPGALDSGAPFLQKPFLPESLGAQGALSSTSRGAGVAGVGGA
jgi:two-component system, cell cycle sensor histidine kinase and response regulator CckA